MFQQTKDFLLYGNYQAISAKEKIARGMQELDFLIQDKGEEVACREMRKRFSAYSKGIEGSSQLRFAIVSSIKRQDYAEIFKKFL